MNVKTTPARKAGKWLLWVAKALGLVVYEAAVFAIAVGGIAVFAELVERVVSKEEEPVEAVLDDGGGRAIRIPAPEGTSGSFMRAVPPDRPWAYVKWYEAYNESLRGDPYRDMVSVPDIALEFTSVFDYCPTNGSLAFCENEKCRIMVGTWPEGNVSTWAAFREFGEELGRKVAAEKDGDRWSFTRGGRFHDVRSVSELEKGDKAFEISRFVWVEGRRFLLHCERVNPPGGYGELAALLDGWLDEICAASQISREVPGEDEIALGDAFAAARLDALRKLRRFSPYGKSTLSYSLVKWTSTILSVTLGIALIVAIGCLSVTAVWALALAVAIGFCRLWNRLAHEGSGSERAGGQPA